MKTKLKLSTVFHSQTDGQTERTNHTVEQIIRCYIDYNQTNWDDLLTLVEFAINSCQQTSTDHSPFYLNYGFNPQTPDEAALPDSPYPEAHHSAEEIQAAITLVKDLLAEAQECQKHLPNNTAKTSPLHLEIKCFSINPNPLTYTDRDLLRNSTPIMKSPSLSSKE